MNVDVISLLFQIKTEYVNVNRHRRISNEDGSKNSVW